MQRKRAEFTQFVRCPLRDFLANLDLRWIEPIGQQGYGNQKNDTCRRDRGEPVHPGNIEMRGLVDDFDSQQVRSERSQEQRTGYAGRREGDPHDIGTDSAGRRIVRLRLIEAWQVADNRIDSATAARGVRRRKGRQHGISEGNAVSECQGPAPQELDQQ